MKLYEVGPLEDGSEFLPTKREAIERAKFYGVDYGFVDEIEIGKLTKAVACALASGRGYAVSRKRVWTAE